MSLQLLLRRPEFLLAQRLTAQPFHFLHDQFAAPLGILLATGIIHIPQSAVAVVHHPALHRVDQSVFLAQLQIQAGVHGRSTQDVVHQVERHPLGIAHAVGTVAHDLVALVDESLLFHADVEGSLQPVGCDAGMGRCLIPRSGGRGAAFQFAHHRFKVHVAVDEEHHLLRPVVSAGKAQHILRVAVAQRLQVAEDVPAERMAGKEPLFKVVVDTFRGGLLIAVVFVHNHLQLLLQFLFGIGAVEHHVAEQVDGGADVVFQQGGIIGGVLFGGEGVQVASQPFQTVDDVARVAPFRSLETQVLAVVGHAALFGELMAGAGGNAESAVDHLRGGGAVDDSQPVGQGKSMVFHVVLG